MNRTNHQPDDAVIFYVASELFKLGTKHPEIIAEVYEGEDRFAVCCMRTAREFDLWCRRHVDFEKTNLGVWAYEIAERVAAGFTTLGAEAISNMPGMGDATWAGLVSKYPGIVLHAAPLQALELPTEFLASVAIRRRKLERKHQGHHHTLAEWLLILESDIAKAKAYWMQGDMQAARDRVMCLAAVTMSCASQQEIK